MPPIPPPPLPAELAEVEFEDAVELGALVGCVAEVLLTATTAGVVTLATVVRTICGLLTDDTTLLFDALGNLTIWYCPVSVLTKRWPACPVGMPWPEK